MKTLFVIPNYEPAWSFGGVMRCVSTLCRGLSKMGVLTSVYTTNLDGRGGLLPVTPGEKMEVGGVNVTYYPTTFGANSDWDSRAMVRKMRGTIKEFDIIYIAASWQWIGIAASKVAFKYGVPYIHSTHGSFGAYSYNKSKIKKNIYWNLFLRKCFENASAIHVTTEYERQNVTALKCKCPSFVVPNSILPDAFNIGSDLSSRVRNEFRIPALAPLIVTVGRTDPVKRLDLAIKSLSNVVRQVPSARLMIVGDTNSSYADKMKRLVAELGLSSAVIWTGFRTGEDLKGCYAAADLFLLPSMDENFGMVVIEAMAAKVPVIVSDRVGVAYDIEQNEAGIVTETDVDKISDAIIDLLQDRSRLSDLGNLGKKMVMQNYSADRVAKKMLTAFNDILNHTQSKECLWLNKGEKL